jgi:LytS/YehU family sensor histidine kinase
MVHSICIASMCWFFIDVGRVPLARWKHRKAPTSSAEAESNWPGWPLMLVIVVIGSMLGFTVGGTLASWLTGLPMPGYLRGSLRQTVALVLTSLVPALIITYWFYSRETIAAHEAATQVAERQAAENQLKLLESQLEPHMLFNTLANLRVLIATDPARAQLMLDRVVSFLRSTLTASRHMLHPLSSEFARLDDYLSLMKVRMGERLQTRLDLPEPLVDVAVPTLLLQPLVENAIKHGLEPHVDGGQLVVSAARDGADLRLSVRDTGVGLSELPSASADGTGFGVTQIRERLATLYGPSASLQLSSPEANDPLGPRGTLAVVRIPFNHTA